MIDLARELLEAALVVAEIVLRVLVGVLELLLAGEVVLARLVGHDLALELLDDHRRAPRALLLRAEDVAVDVVADVEDLVARDAEGALEIEQVASLVDLAALQRKDGGAHLVSFALEERPSLLEEG